MGGWISDCFTKIPKLKKILFFSFFFFFFFSFFFFLGGGGGGGVELKGEESGWGGAGVNVFVLL